MLKKRKLLLIIFSSILITTVLYAVTLEEDIAETIGSLTATELYLGYNAVAVTADAYAARIYNDETALAILTGNLSFLLSAQGYYNKLRSHKSFDVETRTFFTSIHEANDYLILATTALIEYIKEKDDHYSNIFFPFMFFAFALCSQFFCPGWRGFIHSVRVY